MLDLMYSERTFCQFFFSRETKKLTAYTMLVRISCEFRGNDTHAELRSSMLLRCYRAAFQPVNHLTFPSLK